MYLRAILGFILSIVVMLVVSCAGGGSDSNSSNFTDADSAPTQGAGLTATLHPEKGMVDIVWKDTFTDALSYRLMSQASDASWTELDGISGNHGSGTILALQRAVAGDMTLRVEAILPTHSVPLQTVDGKTSIVVVLPKPTEPMAILLDQSEPVSGSSVRLYVSGASSALSVEWYIDLQSIGVYKTIAPSFVEDFDPRRLTTGSHLITARVQTGSGSYIELRRTVEINTATVSVKVGLAPGTEIPENHPYGPARYKGAIDVYVIGTSDYGIQSIEAAIDGRSLGTLTEPNGCLFFNPLLAGLTSISVMPCDGPASNYLFPINTANYRSGTHFLTAAATDKNGQTATITRAVILDNPPVLAVTSPIDGQLVYGNLPVTGTVTSDKPGNVSTTVTLGSVPILNSEGEVFNTTYDLTGVSPGNYTLTVKSTDSGGTLTSIQRTITVVSSPDMVRAPLVTIGESGTLLAAEGTKVLYRAVDNSVRLRDVNGSETTLQDSSAIHFDQYHLPWLIANTNVFSIGKGKDCTVFSMCIYWWKPDGTITNLSNISSSSNPSPYPGDHPVAHYPYIIWNNESSGATVSYTVYNLQTGTHQTVLQPASVSHLGNTDYDFYIQNGVVNFYFWGTSGGDKNDLTSDIFRWDSESGQTVRLTSDGTVNLYVQTDGQRVAWQRTATQSSIPPYNLNAILTPLGSIQTLSTTMGGFMLHDGILAWFESAPNSYGIKAATMTTTHTLSLLSTSNLLGVGGGDVVYVENGKLYAWNPGVGSKLLLDSAPGGVFVTGKTLYVTNGVSQAVYSFKLP